MLINAYCEPRGWLFDDLRRELAAAGAVPSDEPLAHADAWICLRSRERRFSPNPGRTVLQVHDMETPPAPEFGAVALVHPVQLADHPNGLVLPIGARECPPAPLPRHPAVGFFCREVNGRKGSDLFGQAVLLAREHVRFEVHLIGERLEHIAELGIYQQRGAIPRDFGLVDALVVCSQSPMVPLSAYEACAAGVRVISTPRQWIGPGWGAVHTAATAEALADEIIDAVTCRQRFAPHAPFTRAAWAQSQVALAKGLA